MNSECSEYVVDMKGITKRFPGILANDHIDFNLRKGEIHTLLGENGAGKTTLMNVLSGMYQPDDGEISVKGKPADIRSPHDALALGIGMVYQHFTLVPTLSVVENIVLGYESHLFLDLTKAEKGLKGIMSETGLGVDPHATVWHLSVGQQQRVEIIKVLYRGSEVLVLDEPTSVLTPFEAEELFKILKKLILVEKSVIFITHKLEEAVRISDRITVLRQGKKVEEIELRGLKEIDAQRRMNQIIRAMFGRIQIPHTVRESRDISEKTVLMVRELTARNDMGFEALRGLSFTLRRGEILGIAGVEGNGQKELAEAITGRRKIKKGEIELDGTSIANKGIACASRMGVSYVTDDRMGEGCVGNLSLAENMILKGFQQEPFSKYHFLNRRSIAQHSSRLMEEFNIKASDPWTRVNALSGGNIQKLLLARELSTHPRVLVCCNPTHGLDAMTTRFIRDRIKAETRQGTAVILISSDLDEILELSDRVGVLFRGEILSVSPSDEVKREEIGKLMLGIRN
ncbi:MAG: ATP-binding cassette domain-containing protein [Proteobacteria bacterium]|nr:ATP-binding cassette domain-containing protein [Pseudomonadota bacterium]NIS67636.1 ATP-binding cassette domain-containing protein [Pseudomonadota bacterium]